MGYGLLGRYLYAYGLYLLLLAVSLILPASVAGLLLLVKGPGGWAVLWSLCMLASMAGWFLIASSLGLFRQLLIDGASPWQALQSSWQMTRGRRWRWFGLQSLLLAFCLLATAGPLYALEALGRVLGVDIDLGQQLWIHLSSLLSPLNLLAAAYVYVRLGRAQVRPATGC